MLKRLPVFLATVGLNVLIVAGILTAVLAWAQTGHCAEPDDPNAAPLSISAQAGGVVTVTGDAGSVVTPTGFVSADGPLALGRSTPARLYARVGLTTEPGQRFDFARPETFRAAEVGLGAYRVIGRHQGAGQDITTAVVGEWGFSNVLGSDPAPAERLVRHYGAGLRFDERERGASATILYGRDESAGVRGWGQWLFFAEAPLPGTKGILRLSADATLSVGPRHPGLTQRDILRVGVVLGPPR